MSSKTGDISTSFRSRKPLVDRKLNKIQDVLKEKTSHKKTSVNQVLNFSVILADKYLQHIENEKSDINHELEQLNQKKKQLELNIQEAIRF